MSNPTKSRREFLKISSAAAFAGGAIFSVRAESDPSRIALVIGNNAYQEALLGNAVNDAKAVGTLLERAGFAVTLKTDIKRDALRHQRRAVDPGYDGKFPPRAGLHLRATPSNVSGSVTGGKQVDDQVSPNE